jgi:hypothetical protein
VEDSSLVRLSPQGKQDIENEMRQEKDRHEQTIKKAQESGRRRALKTRLRKIASSSGLMAHGLTSVMPEITRVTYGFTPVTILQWPKVCFA